MRGYVLGLLRIYPFTLSYKVLLSYLNYGNIIMKDTNKIDWITDRLPEEDKVLLLFDNIEGLNLGYFKADFKVFYSLDNIRLDDVSAWLQVPDKPSSFSRVIDTVRNKHYIDTFKKSGGTQDV